MKKKKDPEFGQSYKLENFHFETLPLRERLLLILSRLSGGGDLALDILYHPYRYFSHEPLVSKETLYNLISREVRVGEIEKVVRDGKVFLQIAAEGEEWLARRYPLLGFQERKWDGFWRLACFDIPEEERKTRDVLRVKLESLGFGMMQKSLWLTPFDVAKALRSFLEVKGLSGQVFVLEAKKLFSGNDRLLARQVWPIDMLNALYKDWLSKVGRAKSEREMAKLGEIFLQLLEQDPCLPKELLPKEWWGFPALRKYQELTKKPGILPAAVAAFLGVRKHSKSSLPPGDLP